MSDEQIGQHLEHVVRADLASHHDRQALPRVLVQHCQQLQRTPVVRPRGHEVVRPDVAPIQRPQPDARSVVEPQPTSLRLPLRDLQPLLPPDPLHPLVVHPPALDAEHVRDASVAVAAESTRESHDITSERPLVTRHFPRPALGRAWLPEHPARSPLRRPELLTYTHHTTSSALGAQKFPSAASLQDQLVQCQVRHCSLQAPVLALELLQAPCLAHLHPAVLPPPPVVRLLGDAQLPADQLHGFAAGQTDLCPPAVQ